ncbi:Na+/H+-dicarboxylate symporter [Cerasibacillus quisquiliarum]|uniref:Dicarboxylate:amino acid:cation symporter DAACS family protein n=1 Tax=Cerasibacillus quisquiliarum TaxID=227865 RepID=A0A511UX07_9BACI|nr:dicarboxylate/amino acid:cation symporter [Cerasibacillus quisquiliarum]MBB5145117.1 Na+/H+-dicarboxylate symporter [Cerasibacillus quisquiliarum]GEN29993.1 dicarboxylate:amino acid:cation symporter DAACS family protein [Cerasibacillus quisquiliarum]
MTKNFIWQIIGAFILALIVGIVFGEKATYVEPLGELFLRLIKFIIVPLILTTIIVGMSSTNDLKKLGRLGGKTISYYLITSFIAISIGILSGIVFSPGSGTDIKTPETNIESTDSDGILNTILNIIPTNPLESLADGAILQIIFFAIFIGLGISLVGEKAIPVRNFFNGFAEIMYRITSIVMTLVPIGIFGLLAPVVGNYGLSVLLPLIKLIVAMLIASLIHIFIIYSIAVKALGKMNPLHFFKGIFPAASVAFSTCSSSGTLPITMKNTEENLGVSKETCSFVLPLGATINMDGTAIYQGVAVMFIAQYFNTELSLAQLLTVALIATLASIGTAGVPGAGMVMLTMVLTAVHLPLEGIALIAGIDRILDMIRTTINIVGDASASVVIEESERKWS